MVPLSTRAKGNDDAVRREKMDEEGEELKKGGQAGQMAREEEEKEDPVACITR